VLDAELEAGGAEMPGAMLATVSAQRRGRSIA
jgi:hypothetical protein